MITLLAMSPLGPPPFGYIFLALACPPLSLLVLTPVIFGFKSRRYWGVVAYFWCGVIGAAMLAISLLIVVAALLYSFAHPVPMIGLTLFFGAFLLAITALLPKLIRALRLRYWQPWTSPAQWELGNEQIPEWALNMAGRTRR